MLEKSNMGLEAYQDIESEIERKQNGLMSFDIRVHEGNIDEITFREHSEWGDEVVIYEETKSVVVCDY